MVKVVQLLGIFALCLVVDSKSTEQVGGSWICAGDNPDSRCGLQCLFYPKYTGGKCVNNACECFLRYAPVVLSKDPVPNGPCSNTDGEVKCSLQCLFYTQFTNGFCQDGVCMCVPK